MHVVQPGSLTLRAVRRLAVAITILGGGLIAWGWLRQGTTTYLPALLLEIGATLLLFAPLAFLALMLERRVTSVQVRTDQLEGQVEIVQEELRQTGLRLDELDPAIATRLATSRSADARLVEAVQEDASFENVLALLDRGVEQRAITSHGPRVALQHIPDRVRFSPTQLSPGQRMIWIRLEEAAGTPTGVMASWNPTMSVPDVWEQLVQSAQGLSRYPGDTILAATPVLGDLIKTISRALTLRTDPGGSHDLTPVIEILDGDWALTEGGLEHLGDPPYPIGTDRLLQDEYLCEHMLEKIWAQADQVRQALSVAIGYHKRRVEQSSRLGQPQW